jgi:hypothetical protein
MIVCAHMCAICVCVCVLHSSRAVAVFTHTDGNSVVESLPSEGQRCTAATRYGYVRGK